MKVISFNSYKGGACRTTTCYNTLPFLAQELGATSAEPIIVFDADLDSFGMTNLMHSKKHSGSVSSKYSARNLFVDDDNGINRSLASGQLMDAEGCREFLSYFTRVGNRLELEDDGAVLFCGVDANLPTISDAMFKKFENQLPLAILISNFERANGCRPKAIVFDCAAGVQQTTVGVLRNIDKAVVCMRPTSQFRSGTKNYLLNTLPVLYNSTAHNMSRKVILLPTAVAPIPLPNSDEDKVAYDLLTDLRQDSFDALYGEIVKPYTEKVMERKYLGYTLVKDMLDFDDEENMGIPEIQRFKWIEEDIILKTPNLTKQEQKLKAQYQKLAKILAED